ncbi:MAG TPA: O-antigen ligase family protein [Candidatus Cybelea sp.]|nr:O-antigen ligase family protein [Candidatus Cybelea sp.]
MIAKTWYGSALARMRLPVVPIAFTCVLFAAAMWAAVFGASLGVSLALALLPLLLALSWSQPLLFPYGAYVMLVPFDLLLSIPQLGTVARLCGALSGVVLLLWLVRNRRIVLPGPAVAVWGLFVLWSCISNVWAPDWSNAMRESGTLLQLLGLYAIVSLVPAAPRDVAIVFGAVVLGGAVAAIFGIRELAHLSVAQQLINQVSDRIPLLVGASRLDINEFADSLLLPMALVSAGTVRTHSIPLKVCGVGVIAGLLYAMSLAASREAFVAVALMFGYFIAVLPERRQIIAIGVVLAGLAAGNGNLVARFLSASVSGGSGRLSIWTAGLAAFRQHWTFGSGSGSFATAYDQVYLKIFQPYDMGWSRAAHNMLIQNGVEYGIVGLLLLATAVILTIRTLPKLRTDHPLFGMRAGVVGAILALSVAGFFVDLTTAKFFWLALALAALLRAAVVATPVHPRRAAS